VAETGEHSTYEIMSIFLNRLGTPVQACLLRKGTRVFGLVGKATSYGITAFGRSDVFRGWALTAEFGCLRLERLSGDEEVMGDELLLPTPHSYEFGILGGNACPELTRAVFGLLSSELEQLVTVLRQGGFPVLGFSRRELRCSLTGNIIPGHWPHVVVSSRAIYGNVVSPEAFMRLMVSSLPQGQLAVRFPSLQPIFKQMMKLLIVQRRGIPYSDEVVELTPAAVLAGK